MPSETQENRGQIARYLFLGIYHTIDLSFSLWYVLSRKYNIYLLYLFIDES
jgi:hypothetical protein